MSKNIKDNYYCVVLHASSRYTLVDTEKTFNILNENNEIKDGDIVIYIAAAKVEVATLINKIIFK